MRIPTSIGHFRFIRGSIGGLVDQAPSNPQENTHLPFNGRAANPIVHARSQFGSEMFREPQSPLRFARWGLDARHALAKLLLTSPVLPAPPEAGFAITLLRTPLGSTRGQEPAPVAPVRRFVTALRLPGFFPSLDVLPQ